MYFIQNVFRACAALSLISAVVAVPVGSDSSSALLKPDGMYPHFDLMYLAQD